MKKLILGVALLASASNLVLAQGTIDTDNTFTTHIFADSTASGGSKVLLPTSSQYDFGVFYGTTQGSLSTMTLLGTLFQNSTTSAGIIAGGTIVPLPSTNPGDKEWIVVAGWTASFGNNWQLASTTPGAYFGQSTAAQISLGATAGPGTPIFSTTAGFIPGFSLDIVATPEPTTLALGGLGAVALMFIRRRK